MYIRNLYTFSYTYLQVTLIHVIDTVVHTERGDNLWDVIRRRHFVSNAQVVTGQEFYSNRKSLGMHVYTWIWNLNNTKLCKVETSSTINKCNDIYKCKKHYNNRTLIKVTLVGITVHVIKLVSCLGFYDILPTTTYITTTIVTAINATVNFYYHMFGHSTITKWTNFTFTHSAQNLLTTQLMTPLLLYIYKLVTVLFWLKYIYCFWCLCCFVVDTNVVDDRVHLQMMMIVMINCCYCLCCCWWRRWWQWLC